jgi:pimeloyl-ACP methyl ester carboxylesterase
LNSLIVHTVKSPDGTSIAYYEGGTGPSLLLVHGATADHTRWAPVIPRLAEHLTVYAMDRRGRGQSGDAADYAIEREFEDVAAVVNAIGGPVFLLGHSYGAFCALEATLQTRSIAKLILYEPPPQLPPPPDVMAKINRLLQKGQNEEALMTFQQEMVRAPQNELENMRSLPSWPGRVASTGTLPREIASAAEYSFQAERFQAMAIPTLLLLGGESGPPVVAATERIHDALPASRIERLPGQRHSAMDTAPGLLAECVLHFLINKTEKQGV